MTRIASIIFVTWVQVHASGSAPIGVHRSRKAVTNGRRRRRNSNVTPTSPPPCFASHLRYHRIYDDSLLSTKLASAKNSCDGVIDRNRRMNKSDINALVKGIGLEPVVQAPFTKKKKKRNHHHIDSSSILHQLSTSFPKVSLRTQLDYALNGHAALRSFLPPTLIQQIRSELVPHANSHAISAWRQKVEVQLADSSDEYYQTNAHVIADNLQSVEECQDLLESLGIEDLPFLQHFNSWRYAAYDKGATEAPSQLAAVRKLCLSPYLAKTASVLLNTSSVRLYQDSLFHKRTGDGWTPWHSDARMAPFDTSKMITFWIPLQKIPTPEEGGTGLHFVDGSHSDFALPYWNGVDGKEYDRLESRYGNDGDDGVSHHMPLTVGDVTVHNGWTLHCADAAHGETGDGSAEDRYAFSITYVDGKAELREDVLCSSSLEASDKLGGENGSKESDEVTKGDKEDIWSFRSWVEEVEPRREFKHPMVPIVWPSDKRG